MKRRAGDRKDGTLIRDLDPLHMFTAILYPNRCDNEAFIQENIELEPIQKYIDEKNKDADFKWTFFHVIVAAIAKCITLRPLMNRFIANCNYYQRNEVTLSFVVKKEFNDKSREALAVVHAKPEDTIISIHDNIKDQIKLCRSDKEDGSTASMTKVGKLPRWIVKAFTKYVCHLDKHGRVPASFIESDPFYTSCVLSNLGSIKLKCGYHHLTNWGTCSFFCVVGEKKKRPYYDENGNMTMKESLGLGLTVDERIADGYYFSKSVKLLKYLLNNPKELEKPLNEEVDYDK